MLSNLNVHYVVFIARFCTLHHSCNTMLAVDLFAAEKKLHHASRIFFVNPAR
jgi:hypothetical protein